MTGQGQPENPLAHVVPYKNSKALISYYLGVFSLIPCLGAVLALVSIPLGILGLKHAKSHPQSKGTVHAWVGIVLGSLVLLGHIALIAIPALLEP